MTDTAVVTVSIDATPEIVFSHLVERDKMLRWMGVRVELDPTPGGSFTIEMNDEITARGAYVEVVPNERVVFTWGWVGNEFVPPGSSTVAIDIEPDGEGTHLTLTHSGLPDEAAYVQHGEGWTHFLGRLVLVGAGKDPGPDPIAEAQTTSG